MGLTYKDLKDMLEDFDKSHKIPDSAKVLFNVLINNVEVLIEPHNGINFDFDENRKQYVIIE